MQALCADQLEPIFDPPRDEVEPPSEQDLPKVTHEGLLQAIRERSDR